MKTINYGIMQVQTDEGFMKTPTKEQIRKITEMLCRKECEFRTCKKCPYYQDEVHCEDRRACIEYYIKPAILAWEKIKS